MHFLSSSQTKYKWSSCEEKKGKYSHYHLSTFTSLCLLMMHTVFFPSELLNSISTQKLRMKFEDFLMQRQKRRELEEEVVQLEEDLDKEFKLNRLLQRALLQPIISRPLCSWVPLQVQMLLAEVTIVEQEVISLERKLEELKLCLYQERKHTKECQILKQKQGRRRKHRNREDLSFRSAEDFRSQRWFRERTASAGSASEITTPANDKLLETPRDGQPGKQRLISGETYTEDPNRLSEELMSCLIGIFLKLNQSLDQHERVPKLGLSCINSKGLVAKTSFNCKAPVVVSDTYKRILDPYGILHDIDATDGEVGPYKSFMQFTRSSLDMSRLPGCFSAFGKLRVLIHKLSTLDLSFLTYKQKLAFWINVYNACIMHAYLQHGLPTTIDKQLELMNKAALNVGGIILNALAIEHFILRHPYDSNNGEMDERERLLWHAYGLGYPEPNITFALCRGCWSSPALRIYTAEDVVNELGKAKVEYLEASVGVSSKKKILVPKLLHWHMQDFADNMESLLEWIYSQLPRSRSVNQLIMECLNGETRTPITTMVDVQPYESEFRYLLPQ